MAIDHLIDGKSKMIARRNRLSIGKDKVGALITGILKLHTQSIPRALVKTGILRCPDCILRKKCSLPLMY